MALHIYHGSIGRDTNNVAELEGLWKGICTTVTKNLFPLVIEGDSQILIEAVSWIQSDTSARKITSSWRLLSRLEQIEDWFRSPRSVTFQHVRQSANKVVDRLANQGSDQQLPFFSGPLSRSNDEKLKHECTLLVQQDLSLPDVGDRDR